MNDYDEMIGMQAEQIAALTAEVSRYRKALEEIAEAVEADLWMPRRIYPAAPPIGKIARRALQQTEEAP